MELDASEQKKPETETHELINDDVKICLIPCSTPQYRPEREKRPPCPVPAILPVFPYPGDVLESSRVERKKILKANLKPSIMKTTSDH